MSDETRRVLDMLSQGKITVDEADQLLAAMGSGPAGTATAAAESAGTGTATAEARSPRYLRITIHRTGNAPDDDAGYSRRARMWHGHAFGRNGEVSMRVPVALVRNGIRLGSMIPGISGGRLQARLRERGVDMDLSRIDAETIDQLLREFGEVNIDLDSGNGRKAQVRITCEP